ncbi:PLP-dependent aminotransferase family protein [Glycomyces scopariae]
MAKDWTTFRELLVADANRSAPGRRRSGLEHALREAVRTRTLHPGTRLPSSRDLAAQLGLSRGTVTAVYEQLTAEGYLHAKRGSGTRVALLGEAGAGPAPAASSDRPLWPYDLGPGLPSLGAFPRSAWLSAMRAALAGLGDHELGYPDPAGLRGLRTELAAYLGRVRSTHAGADDLVITHGTFAALALVLGGLETGDRVAVEDPSGPDLIEAVRSHGLEAVPVPVDDEGLRTDALAATGCRTVVVTASHQYPLGVTMSARRRRALVSWARRCEGTIIEDDYDSEYRYGRVALGALQGMAPERTVYLGTLSKTLAPAVRLGWMAAPPLLRDACVRRASLTSRGCSALEQSTFANLLAGGAYDRHLRRTRALYRRRRDALVEALAEHLPEWEPIGTDAGLHVVVRLPSGPDTETARRLAAAGVRVAPLSAYRHREPGFPGLVLGFAGLTPDRLRAAIATAARTQRA